uniref:Uncharacterized protein n=1 Tax=Anopheles dirus TaxID=7168 RepID=A0A182NPJ8_9DIPT
MKRTPRKPSVSGFSVDRESLAEWAKDKPLSILQLDPADRAVLRIAGETLRGLRKRTPYHRREGPTWTVMCINL